MSASQPLPAERVAFHAARGARLAALRDASRQASPAFRPLVERAEDRAVAHWQALAQLTRPLEAAAHRLAQHALEASAQQFGGPGSVGHALNVERRGSEEES